MTAFVVGPDGVVVVETGVVAPFARGHRPDPPSTGQHLTHKPVGNEPGLLRRNDVAPEEVTRVGGDGIHLSPGTVEGEGVVAPVLHPEVPVEALPKSLGIRTNLSSQFLVFPHPVGELGGPKKGIIDVALNLARAIEPSARLPSRKSMESAESFQPWF
jgi:hypothetical protein